MSNTTISQSGSLEPTKVVIYTKLTPRQAALVTSWRAPASNLGPQRLEDYRCRTVNDAGRNGCNWMNPSNHARFIGAQGPEAPHAVTAAKNTLSKHWKLISSQTKQMLSRANTA